MGGGGCVLRGRGAGEGVVGGCVGRGRASSRLVWRLWGACCMLIRGVWDLLLWLRWWLLLGKRAGGGGKLVEGWRAGKGVVVVRMLRMDNGALDRAFGKVLVQPSI